MKYVSVFSGIEAASVAWGPLGWDPVAFSEVEPFPCALLEKRFPSVANLGDITKADWSCFNGSVDIVVGGSPCQAFSIAGGRGVSWIVEVCSCSNSLELFEKLALRGFCGKTSPVSCRKTADGLLLPCKGSWKTSGIRSRGECWTRSSSELPSDAVVSFLSDTLEPNAPRRYYLTPRACAGILRRAATRGRDLPPMLKDALEEVMAGA